MYEHGVVEARAVYVGYGLSASERNHDDYAGVDVRGKAVALLVGAPASFPGDERAYYSSRDLKYRTAAAHGAIAILTLIPPEAEKRVPFARLGQPGEDLHGLGGGRSSERHARGDPRTGGPEPAGRRGPLLGLRPLPRHDLSAVGGRHGGLLRPPRQGPAARREPTLHRRQPQRARGAAGLGPRALEGVRRPVGAPRPSRDRRGTEGRLDLQRSVRQCVGGSRDPGGRARPVGAAPAASPIDPLRRGHRGREGAAGRRILRPASDRSGGLDGRRLERRHVPDPLSR